MRIPDCFMHQLRNKEHIVNDLPTVSNGWFGRTETLLPATATAGPTFASDTIISRLETLAQ
jgi:hypothetical protein